MVTVMTREDWDRTCKRRISAVMAQGWDSAKAIHWANESTTQDYGPRPEPPEKPDTGLPWWGRAAVVVAVPKENRQMAQRILVALMYAIGVGMGMYQASGIPTTPEAWVGFVLAVVVAFWGKFSSSTTVISPNRVGEVTQPPITL